MPNWNNERLEEKARLVVLPMLFSAIVLTALPACCTSSFSQCNKRRVGNKIIAACASAQTTLRRNHEVGCVPTLNVTRQPWLRSIMAKTH